MVRTTKVDDVYGKNSAQLCINFLPHFKIRNDKINIAKISVTKLSKIVDPQSKLRKAVLINNTLKHLQKHTDLWHLDSGGGHLLKENKVTEQEEFENTSNENSKGCSNKLDGENALSEDMLTLYDDIVNDIFGSNEETSDLGVHHKDDTDKENVIAAENYKENYLWSPYSYNSFLSELYTVSNDEKFQN